MAAAGPWPARARAMVERDGVLGGFDTDGMVVGRTSDSSAVATPPPFATIPDHGIPPSCLPVPAVVDVMLALQPLPPSRIGLTSRVAPGTITIPAPRVGLRGWLGLAVAAIVPMLGKW